MMAMVLGQDHTSVGAVFVGTIFNLIAVAGDVDEGWTELQQRFYAGE